MVGSKHNRFSFSFRICLKGWHACFRLKLISFYPVNLEYSFITYQSLSDHTKIFQHKSRSKQAPGGEFHRHDKSDKIYCGFLGPSLCNKKVNPETYVSCGSYELLLSNVSYQMKEKLTTKNNFPQFKVKCH